MKDEVSNDNILFRIPGFVRQLLFALRIPAASTPAAELSLSGFFPREAQNHALIWFYPFPPVWRHTETPPPHPSTHPCLALLLRKTCAPSALIPEWHLLSLHSSYTGHTTSVWHVKREAVLIYCPWREKQMSKNIFQNLMHHLHQWTVACFLLLF